MTQDGPGPPRLAIFGNTGELRLEEVAAREGGQIRGTFTIRGAFPLKRGLTRIVQGSNRKDRRWTTSLSVAPACRCRACASAA